MNSERDTPNSRSRGVHVEEFLFDKELENAPRDLAFTLAYKGNISSKEAPLSAAHSIRLCMHQQLRDLWNENHFLREKLGYIAEQFSRCGYRCVPLVNRIFSRRCSLDILFLRPGIPGPVINNGLADGRVKALFDGLKIIRRCGDLPPYAKPSLSGEEELLFCLIEDEGLISRIKISTDQLFAPEREGEVIFVIRIHLEDLS